ncbi:hypothetical protein [Mesorhizobium sp. GR13]|uniref:hypothetical protein n=1 Tax=Mesorhizobium sp. GR13 TaxID=2562308 RepID=UPI0010C138E3|nr:hypothetical protein [Mesorhizobium sp. GR13]
MVGILDFLSGILNPEQQNRLAAVAQPSNGSNRLLFLGGDDTPAGGGTLDAVGQRIMQQQLNPYMGGATPINAQPAVSGTASASTMQDDPASKSLSGSQTAATGRAGSASASGQGFGGFLQNLLISTQK